MKNLKYFIFSIITILLFSSVGYSQMRDRGDRNMRGTHMETMMNKLQLTDDQQKEITALRLQHQERLVDLTSELKKEQIQKEKILSGDVVERNELIKITNEIGNTKNKIAAERVNHQMDVYNILDSNQRQTWQKMMLNMDKMKNKMRGKMMNGMHERMRDKMNPPNQN